MKQQKVLVVLLLSGIAVSSVAAAGQVDGGGGKRQDLTPRPFSNTEQEQYMAHTVTRMYEATYGGQEKCKSDKDALDRLNKTVDQFRHAYPELMSLIENSPYLPQAKEHLKLGRDPSGKYDLQACRETEAILRQLLIVPEGQRAANYMVQILKGKDRSAAEAEIMKQVDADAEKQMRQNGANGTPPKPPLIVPFEAQKAGSTFMTELRVVEHRYYEFTILLKLKEGATMEDARSLSELAGWFGRDGSGKLRKPGISIPVKLKVRVIDAAGERTIYDKEIYEEEVQGGGGAGIEKLIDSIELRPGRYRINIESLKDIPELTGYPINFGIDGHYNTNPID